MVSQSSRGEPLAYFHSLLAAFRWGFSRRSEGWQTSTMHVTAVVGWSLWHGVLGRILRESFWMFYETFWPLVLGFGLSGVVQAFVSRAAMERSFGSLDATSVSLATVLGAISSSCSYAASSMAHALWKRGANFVTALIFMVASTNLVIELGIVLIVLMGWQFALGEFLGGVIMIVLLALLGSVVLLAKSTRPSDAAAERPGGALPSSSPRTLSGWSDAASYTVADLTMLRRELVAGFLIAGAMAAAVPNSVWNVVFLKGHGLWTTLENALVGPLVAVASFVCSIGNVPLAAALWHGGISFGGVLAFLFADLITFPLLLIYRRYYGGGQALRIFFTFWATMTVAGLLTEGIIAVAGWTPTNRSTAVMATSHHISADATGILNGIALLVLLGIVVLARQRARLGGGDGYAIDPVCGMQVQVAHASATASQHGTSYFFCAERCKDRFIADPDRFTSGGETMAASHHEMHDEHGAGLSIDPVCGMSVDPATAAATLVHDGTTYAFCNPGCAERFSADPDSFLGAAAEEPADPLVRHSIDPVCGMTVDLAIAAATMVLDGTTYAFCPQSCGDRFAADPERFLRGGPAAMEDVTEKISLSKKPRPTS